MPLKNDDFLLNKDRSFLQFEVTVTPVQLTGSVPIVNGGFDADTLATGATTGPGYNYQTPYGWTGSGVSGKE